MKIIVPMCGKSSRYPGLPPKWMLPSFDGMPMVYKALSGFQYNKNDLILTVLNEHDQKFGVVEGLKRVFGDECRIIVLDTPTKSQAETIYRTLEISELNEPFLVKDSDNSFVIDNLDQKENYTCVSSLNDFDLINPRNKSYVQIDRREQVVNIREKVVISDLFNVGGYFFVSPESFQYYYNKLINEEKNWEKELFLSDVIGAMIFDNIPFKIEHVSKYQDWGTISEWEKAATSRKTYFILLDGLVFERGSNLFSPTFSEVTPNQAVVEAIIKLNEKGNKIIYISIRDHKLRALTEKQLQNLGLPSSDIIFDVPISQYIMITSGHQTLPFKTSLAFEIAANDVYALEKII